MLPIVTAGLVELVENCLSLSDFIFDAILGNGLWLDSTRLLNCNDAPDGLLSVFYSVPTYSGL